MAEAKKQKEISKEEFYGELNSTLKAALTVLKYWIYPLTFVVTIIAFWFGSSLHSARTEISRMKGEAQVQFDALTTSFQTSKNELSSMREDYSSIVEKYKKTQEWANKTEQEATSSLNHVKSKMEKIDGLAKSAESKMNQYGIDMTRSRTGSYRAQEKLEERMVALDKRLTELESRSDTLRTVPKN